MRSLLAACGTAVCSCACCLLLLCWCLLVAQLVACGLLSVVAMRCAAAKQLAARGFLAARHCSRILALTNRSISTACKFRWGLVVEKRRQTWPALARRHEEEARVDAEEQELAARRLFNEAYLQRMGRPQAFGLG